MEQSIIENIWEIIENEFIDNDSKINRISKLLNENSLNK